MTLPVAAQFSDERRRFMACQMGELALAGSGGNHRQELSVGNSLSFACGAQRRELTSGDALGRCQRRALTRHFVGFVFSLAAIELQRDAQQ